MEPKENLSKLNLIKPHFKFEDLSINDLKEDNYTDPYYKLRRPIEPERLKLIYQQAFIYDLLYTFAKEHLSDVQDVQKNKNKALENEKTTDTTIDSLKEKVLEYLFKNQNKIELQENKNVSLKNDEKTDCLWNTDDLNILRREFTKIKETNYSLNSRMAVLQQENIELKEKYDKLKIETSSLPGEVRTFEKENERLYIRIQDLESRYEIYNKEMENADKIIKKMSDEINDLKSINQNITSEKLRLEFELNKHKQKLQSIKNEFKLYLVEKVDSIKLKHQKEIQSLCKKYDDLQNKYKTKSAKLDNNQKALDHLRAHFANNVSIVNTNDKIDDSQIKIF